MNERKIDSLFMVNGWAKGRVFVLRLGAREGAEHVRKHCTLQL